MKRSCLAVLAVVLITACQDSPSSDGADAATETGDGDGDPGDGDGDGDPGDGDGDGDPGDGDGDGDPGDGDGDPGDGDGDVPEIPDGLFATIPDLHDDKLAMAPDHVFVIAQIDFFDDPRVIRVAKSDATVETFATLIDQIFNDLVASDQWLYAGDASDLMRSPFDVGDAWPVIATFPGVGAGVDQILTGSTHVFVRKGASLYRVDPDGANSTTLVTGEPGTLYNLKTNGTRLYGFFEDNLVEIDTQSGAVTQVLEGTTTYHPGQSALYLRIDGALHTASLDGGPTVEFLAESELGGGAFHYADDDQHLYWIGDPALNDDNSVRRVPLAGGEVEIIATFPSAQVPQMITLDETHVWWLISSEEASGLWRYSK